jgi:hypothetical protein
MSAVLHSQDFYAWTQQQAQLLKNGQLNLLDIESLIEELETMGANEKRTLMSRLEVLLMHLLKWQYQPTLQSRSWLLTIEEQRERISDHLADNPSLKNPDALQAALDKAYQYAVRSAEKETGLARSVFPKSCPYRLEQIMDIAFYPDGQIS